MFYEQFNETLESCIVIYSPAVLFTAYTVSSYHYKIFASKMAGSKILLYPSILSILPTPKAQNIQQLSSHLLC